MQIGGKTYKYYDINKLNDERVKRLPISIKVLLECAVRNCNGFSVTKEDVEHIKNWEHSSKNNTEIAFKPARVILQDLTGVPLVVDLAGLRDAVKRLGGNPEHVNPSCPVDLVIDHSVQVDFARSPEAL